MGFISQLSKIQPFDAARSRSVWRENFRATSKEDDHRPAPDTASSIADSNSQAAARLLMAMRSRAPGAWTDDRWQETNSLQGIQYLAIHRTCEQLSQSEFQVFEKDEKHPDGKRPASSPGGLKLIQRLQHPNSRDSFGDWMYRCGQQINLTGSALTWMVPNKFDGDSPKGQSILEMYCIPTATAIPQPAVNPQYPDGYYRIQPYYPYGPFSSYPSPMSATGAPIPAQWMMAVRMPHPLLMYEGFSPMTALRLHIDEVTSMDRSRWYSQRRAFNPSAVLNFDGSPDAPPLPEPEIERIRADFANAHQAPENTGMLFVATPGSKFEPWGTSPKEMDWKDSWAQLVDFILAGFGIGKGAAGLTDGQSYSTLFASLKQFHLLTLKPMCDRVASHITRHMAPFFGDNLIVEIKAPRIDDHEVIERKLRLLMDGRALSKQELRQALDFPVTKEPWGNEFAGEKSTSEVEKEASARSATRGGDGTEGKEDELLQRAMAENPQNEPPGMEDESDPMEKRRPNTGTLNLGSLGPRKGLNGNGKHQGNGMKGLNVNIHLPDGMVKIAPAAVSVHPQISINPKFEIPARKTVRNKQILYDRATNLPSQIVETETEG